MLKPFLPLLEGEFSSCAPLSVSVHTRGFAGTKWVVSDGTPSVHLYGTGGRMVGRFSDLGWGWADATGAASGAGGALAKAARRKLLWWRFKTMMAPSSFLEARIYSLSSRLQISIPNMSFMNKLPRFFLCYFEVCESVMKTWISTCKLSISYVPKVGFWDDMAHVVQQLESSKRIPWHCVK